MGVTIKEAASYGLSTLRFCLSSSSKLSKVTRERQTALFWRETGGKRMCDSGTSKVVGGGGEEKDLKAKKAEFFFFFAMNDFQLI